MESGTSGRLRAVRSTTKEDQAIQSMVAKGEKELATRRIERAEARRLRLLELQRQREAEDKMADAEPVVIRRPRKTIERQGTEEVDAPGSLSSLPADPAKRVRIVEKRWQETLQTRRQLFSDKQQLVKQIEALKDRLEDGDQEVMELRYENLHRRDLIALTHDYINKQAGELEALRAEVAAQANYMADKGIEWPPRGKSPEEESSASPESSEEEEELSDEETLVRDPRGRLESLHPEEKKALLQQIGHLRKEVVLLKSAIQTQKEQSTFHEDNYDLSIRDTARQLSEYKTRLEGTVTESARLETQVQWLEGSHRRLKTQQEEALQLEDELKAEKRKLVREVRQAKSLAQELELENERLQKRVESLHRKRHQRE